MFTGFHRDLAPLTMPGFEVASAVALHCGAPISTYHAARKVLTQIGGWKDWENYGLFVMQNPLFPRRGGSLVAMATLTKDTQFKSVEELLESHEFGLEGAQDLLEATRITRRNDHFYGGFNMPIKTADKIALKVNDLYNNSLKFVEGGNGDVVNKQEVCAVTFSRVPKKNYQLASYWCKTYPLESGQPQLH